MYKKKFLFNAIYNSYYIVLTINLKGPLFFRWEIVYKIKKKKKIKLLIN